jgi:hypothetical protein
MSQVHCCCDPNDKDFLYNLFGPVNNEGAEKTLRNVTPAKAGVQKSLKILDSSLRDCVVIEFWLIYAIKYMGYLRSLPPVEMTIMVSAMAV